MKLFGELNRRGVALAAAAALMTLTAQPCAAAGDPRDIGATVTRTGAFAGGSVRIDVGGRNAAKPSARLQLGMTHSYENVSQTVRAPVLELGASERSAPVLFVGGQKMKDLRTRAGLQSSTGTVLLVVGAVAAAAVLVAMTGSGGDDEECGNDEWFC